LRRGARIAIALILFASAAACDSDGSGGSDGRPVEIVVQVSGEIEETAAYDALVQAYRESNPGARVRLVKIESKDDHLARLSSSIAGGNPPDVFLVNFREYSQFVVRGAIEPIGPMLEEADVSLDAYYPQPLEAFTFDGELQCMPQNISSLVVYYNKALFKDAGIRHPQSWSWEEFRNAADELTQGNVRGLGIEPNIIRIAPFVWSNGGEIVDDPATPTRFTLDEPAAREALEFIVSMVRDGLVPTEEEVAAQSLEEQFAAGKLGMLLTSRRDTPVFREVLQLDWDVAPLPTSEEPAGILHSDAYCIATGSEVDEAFDFVRFATGEQGETLAALAGRTVPSLQSVAQSPAFLDPTAKPRHSRVFLDGIPSIRRTPVIPTWPEIEDIAEEFLTRAFYEEGYTIDQFIADLNDAAVPLFEEAATE
jgi:multiple sugar transport system substrate-binding protein